VRVPDISARVLEDLGNLGRLTVEGSLLARLAEDAQVDRLTARRALRGLAPTNDGQRRFVARLARLSPAQVEELRASVAGAELPRTTHDGEEDCDDEG
jgi:hypothetical protein